MHGQTVCYMHGGASRRKGGAPKGSKNALKTGQYETILASTMTPEELSYRDSLDINPLTTLRETLSLIHILDAVADGELSPSEAATIQAQFRANAKWNNEAADALDPLAGGQVYRHGYGFVAVPVLDGSPR